MAGHSNKVPIDGWLGFQVEQDIPYVSNPITIIGTWRLSIQVEI